MKFFFSLLVIAGVLVTPVIAEEPADLIRFLQNGASAGFLAAAVAEMDDCTVPLSFTQSRDVDRSDRIVLSIGCLEPDNGHAMLLFFAEHGEKKLWLEKTMLIP